MKRFCLCLLLFIATLCGIERYFFKQNHGFSLHLIHCTLPQMQAWTIDAFAPQEKAQIETWLNQKFTYLGKGKQAFVFESEDKQVVLKLYRLPSELRPFAHLSHPLPSSKKRRSFQEVEATFESLKCSFEQLKEETGFLWLHMHKGPSLKKEIAIIDKMGTTHLIPLEEVTAVLQRKGTLLYPTLELLLSQGKLEDAKRAVTHLVTLFYNQARKGYINNDAVLDKNYGLTPHQALIIDSAQLMRDEKLCSATNAKEHAKEMTLTLKDWLQNHSPPLFDHYQKAINAL